MACCALRSPLVSVESTAQVALLVGLVLAFAIAAAALRRFWGVSEGAAEVIAIVRACLQLAAVGSIIALVIAAWWSTALFILVMVTVATFTAMRRTQAQAWWPLLASVVVGAAPTSLITFSIGLVPVTPIAVLPIVGIYIGNTMTAAVLATVRAVDGLEEHGGEVEAALSLGLRRSEAIAMVIRPRAALALAPSLDQTKTVGLVTLPGAFVGTLLGGATPLEAAAVQLLVLGGLMLVQTCAVGVVLMTMERGWLRRRPATQG